jgi:hypothetical protein
MCRVPAVASWLVTTWRLPNCLLDKAKTKHKRLLSIESIVSLVPLTGPLKRKMMLYITSLVVMFRWTSWECTCILEEKVPSAREAYLSMSVAVYSPSYIYIMMKINHDETMLSCTNIQNLGTCNTLHTNLIKITKFESC